jgi:hypothetical protein
MSPPPRERDPGRPSRAPCPREGPVGGACSAQGGVEKCIQNLFGKSEERDQLEDFGVDEWIRWEISCVAEHADRAAPGLCSV